MAAPSSILLKNGVALLRDENDRVVPTSTSILIEGNTITKIAPEINVGQDTEIIDCTDKIISPGFVDTHHHCWQTQLKGRHADELILEYMVTGNAQSCQYTETDVFYGQLSGILEALSAGTTTILDHAHVTMTPDHVRNAIAASASSGIRLVYAYTPIMRVKSFNPLTYHPNPLDDWVMQTFSTLAKEGPWADGRVTLGFGFDFWFLPEQVIKGVFEQVESAGVRTVTVHTVGIPQMGGGSPGRIPNMMKNLGLLDHRTVLSHSNDCNREDTELIRQAGAHISSTPSTELQMTMGRSACFDAAFLDGGASGKAVGAQDIASLGIDCHANNTAYIIMEARLGLQTARNYFNEYYLSQGKSTKSLPDSLSVEAAFNLATISGAKALNLDKEIGRLEEGYKADIVLFDMLSPGMVAGAQHDPLAAIILHSSPADIDTVIVDGIVTKKGGKLVDVVVDESVRGNVGKDKLAWGELAREVVKSRARMQKEMEKIDISEARQTLINLFHVDEKVFVE